MNIREDQHAPVMRLVGQGERVHDGLAAIDMHMYKCGRRDYRHNERRG